MSSLYAGIDLHSNNQVLVITNERDEIEYQKRLPNDLSKTLDALAPYAERLEGLVVESTFNWYWLVDGLMDHGYDVRLANTNAIQQYNGLKYSDDNSDARWLARMLHLDILREGYIYPKEERPIRDLLRKRAHLVRHRTSHILSIKNLVMRNTGNALSSDAIKRLTDERIDELLPNPDLALSVKSSAAVMHCLLTQIRILEKVAEKRVRLRDEFKGLTTIDGVGPILAMTIMLEVGDINRFPHVGNYVSYARCVSGERISNGKKKGKSNTKNGNKYLSWAFSEAATHSIRYNDNIRRFYQRKMAKKHIMVAKRAVAHKLARASYYILRDGTAFDGDRAFGHKK